MKQTTQSPNRFCPLTVDLAYTSFGGDVMIHFLIFVSRWTSLGQNKRERAGGPHISFVVIWVVDLPTGLVETGVCVIGHEDMTYYIDFVIWYCCKITARSSLNSKIFVCLFQNKKRREIGDWNVTLNLRWVGRLVNLKSGHPSYEWGIGVLRHCYDKEGFQVWSSPLLLPSFDNLRYPSLQDVENYHVGLGVRNTGALLITHSSLDRDYIPLLVLD